ncbi:hypothetical protein M885DRAFT_522069 [Pelagophyceae sp. CCMP2097]|nr:hypothetical protein M885DRAFT_522069 [Pelagophyceae sp. CCMP2097]
MRRRWETDPKSAVDGRLSSWKSWPAFDATPPDISGRGVAKYGQRFKWGPLHLTAAELDPLRRQGDALMDAALAEVGGRPCDDALAALQAAAAHRGNGAAAAVLRQALDVPAWVDWDRIERGQRVFVRYLPHAGLSLFYISLVGGFSSGAIVKVLAATGKLGGSPHSAMVRLVDTVLFVVDVMVGGRSSLKPGGRGWCAALRVRALHSAVRARLKASEASWDSAGHRGVAINQEDMCTTLLAFTHFVLVGISALGGSVSKEDREDYLHCWRYVGYLFGVDEVYNPCTSEETAKARLESVFMHIVEPDEGSRSLAKSLLAAPGGGSQESRAFLMRCALCRAFIGDGLADALELPNERPRRVVAILAFLRVYVFCLEAPLLGTLVAWFHVALLRLAQRLSAGGTRRHSIRRHQGESAKKCPFQ